MKSYKHLTEILLLSLNFLPIQLNQTVLAHQNTVLLLWKRNDKNKALSGRF